jgi:hypothetical protein
MSYRWLALLPLVYAAVVTLAAESLPAWLWHGAFAASYLAASAGSLAAARRFGRHDRLHWAWMLMSAAYAIGFVTRLVIGGDTGVPEMSPLVGTLWSLLTLGMNALGVASLVLFARVWTGTGLAPEWRIHVTVLMLALGLLVDAHAALEAARAAAHGDRQALGLLVSVVSDIISVALIGPVLATAVAMRGGLLVWPWLLQFLSCTAWLVDNATVFLPGSWEQRGDLFCRLLGTGFGCTAALAQRQVTASLDEAAAAIPDAPS